MSDEIPIVVTKHALLRFRERFHLGQPEDIQREVREAMKAGRLSPEKPLGIVHRDDPRSLYMWIEDGRRVYAVRHDPDCWVVTTTMRNYRVKEEAA